MDADDVAIVSVAPVKFFNSRVIKPAVDDAFAPMI